MTVDLYAVVVEGKVEEVYLYSQGVRYDPVGQTTANGVLKYTFDAPIAADTTPALEVFVSETIRTSDRVGG